MDFIGSKKEYYSGGRCHSRVLGILVQSFQSMGFITDIERRVKFSKPYKPPQHKRKQFGFKPDITVVNEYDEIIGIIEYETIDGSNEHLLRKKIDYFDYCLPENKSVEFIVYFPTLTTLKKKPNSWVKLNRQKLKQPIANKLIELSAKYPNVDIVYLILDENGFSSKIIKKGTIEDESTHYIWN